MKKFFSFSIIAHLSLLALLLSHSHLPQAKQAFEPYVTISMSKEATVSPPASPKPKVEKTAASKTIKKTEAKKSIQASNTKQIQKEKLSYKEELYHFLKNKNHYPTIAAKLKHSGMVRVKIKINKEGLFEQVYLTSPSNFKTLNEGTLSFLNKVAQFKPLPKNLNTETFEVPIVYEL